MTDELIEAVARAICEADKPNFEKRERWPIIGLVLQAQFKGIAKAAISVIAPAVLEEAAKVADEYAVFHDKHDDGLSGFDYMASGAREVAEDIRTLKTRYEA